MLVGVTGLMGAGKTTLCNKIIELNKDIVYINADKFRHKLFLNKNYINELTFNLNIKITNYKELNNLIYKNDEAMQIYKSIFYKYLFNDLNTYSDKIILLEWALILQDNLQDKFEKLIIVDRKREDILKTNIFPDLTTDEVLLRLDIQEKSLKNCQITIPYIIHKDIDSTTKFIKN